MLTARNVVVLTIAIAVVSLASVCISLMQPPDSGGLAGDSFGTRAHGQRALYETLSELGVRVERLLVPPTEALARDTTLVFWRPHFNLVNIEPAHLHAIAEWVRQGGRVVVAPDRSDNVSPFSMQNLSGLNKPPRNVLEELGLKGVAVKTIDLAAEVGDSGKADENRPPKHRSSSPQALRKQPLADDLNALGKFVSGNYESVPLQNVAIRASGTLAGLEAQVKQIKVPARGLAVITAGESQPSGTVTIIDRDGKDQTLIATYPLGAGELIVIASPEIAENRTIALEDNSVLMAHLLAEPGRAVVFDEFYHGLTIRGNPLWLFTRRGFGATALGLLMAIGFLIWRQSVFLGPPFESTVKPRRSIGEYVEAMSRFLNRGGGSRPFVLEQVRDGALHAVRRELGLPPGREKVEELAAVLARRDPARARQLVEAVGKIDETLSQNQTCRPLDAVRLLQGISNCL